VSNAEASMIQKDENGNVIEYTPPESFLLEMDTSVPNISSSKLILPTTNEVAERDTALMTILDNLPIGEQVVIDNSKEYYEDDTDYNSAEWFESIARGSEVTVDGTDITIKKIKEVKIGDIETAVVFSEPGKLQILLPEVGDIQIEKGAKYNNIEGEWSVASVGIGEGFQGKGLGVKLYLKAVEELLKKGEYVASYLSSGGMTTESAMRVWESLYKNPDKYIKEFPQLKGAFSVLKGKDAMAVIDNGPNYEKQYEQPLGADPAYSIELYPDKYQKNIEERRKTTKNKAAMPTKKTKTLEGKQQQKSVFTRFPRISDMFEGNKKLQLAASDEHINSLSRYMLDNREGDINKYPVEFFAFTEGNFHISNRTTEVNKITFGVTVHQDPSEAVYDIINRHIQTRDIQLGKDFRIPRLRAVVFDSETEEYDGAMSDGVLYVNTGYFNNGVFRDTKKSQLYAATLAEKAANAVILMDDDLHGWNLKLDGLDVDSIEYRELSEQIEKYEEIRALALGEWGEANLDELNVSYQTYIDAYKAKDVDAKGDLALPEHMSSYYKLNKHKLQATLYHEEGHHLHQQFGLTDNRIAKTKANAKKMNTEVVNPYIEKILFDLAERTRTTANASGGIGKGYTTSLKRISNYSLAGIDEGMMHEWFSESFAYWAMENYEGVAPLGPAKEVLDPAFMEIINSIKEKGLDVTTNKQLELKLKTNYDNR